MIGFKVLLDTLGYFGIILPGNHVTGENMRFKPNQTVKTEAVK